MERTKCQSLTPTNVRHLLTKCQSLTPTNVSHLHPQMSVTYSQMSVTYSQNVSYLLTQMSVTYSQICVHVDWQLDACFARTAPVSNVMLDGVVVLGCA
jgi:hypothetical protein